MDFVIERVQLFYQDFIILTLGVLFFRWFFRYIEKKHFNEPNTNTKQYLDTNLKKAFMLLNVPFVYVAAPLTEEFMFRFLLIFFFPTFDATAKIVSILVAVIYGFTHYTGYKVTKAERDAVDEQDLQKANE